MNEIFVPTEVQEYASSTILSDDNGILFRSEYDERGTFESNFMYLTSQKYVNNDPSRLPDEQRIPLEKEQLEKIQFTLNEAVIPFPEDEIEENCGVQDSTWILSVINKEQGPISIPRETREREPSI